MDSDTSSSIEKDRQLILQCISGDREALESLVRCFSDLVYRSVQYTLKARQVRFDQQDLEDFHNTIFLHLFEKQCKKLKQYQGKNGCSLATWIRIITVRIVLNHLRKKGMNGFAWQKQRIALEDFEELRGDAVEPLALMDLAQQERLLKDGIRSLMPRDRLFMQLYFNKRYSVKEVAQAMQLSVDNVYTIKHRAIKRLKSYVDSVSQL